MVRSGSAVFLRTYALALFALLAGICALNVLVDPFGIYRIVLVPGFNDVKTGAGNHVRMAKAGAVRALRPRAIVLGNSRAEFGINPDHPGWRAQPVYNLGISGANIYEILRYFEHANRIQHIEQALLMLDFNQFNAYWENAPDFAEGRLSEGPDGSERPFYAAYDLVPSALSIDALSESFSTVWRSAMRKTTTYLANGQRDWHDDLLFRTAIERFGSYENLFSVEEDGLLSNRSRARRPPYVESFRNANTDVFETFRRLIREAIRSKVDLRLAIGPSHGRYFETYRLSGSWPLWEEWKRELVRAVEEEAEKAGVKPFPLWDFSGFDQYTTEPVPDAADKTAHMRWYFESSHYTTELGDMVQDRVFGVRVPSRAEPSDFGVLLTSANIDAHLARIRKLNRWFRNAQPAVARELQNAASRHELSKDFSRSADGRNLTAVWE